MKIIIKNIVSVAQTLFWFLLCFTSVEAADGGQILEENCAACHQITVPADGSQTLKEKMSRKGPPLYYAGQKYQQAWLEKWLIKPERITPTGGDFWANSIVVTDEGDEIDETKLKDHKAVSESDAKIISEYLMTLKPYPDLVKAGEYKPGKSSGVLARKNFRKFKGCVACHRDKEDFGGVTGPELYTAMKRLQPEYVASYIRNPVAWEPKSLMPNKHLNDPSIYKLMNYMNSLVEED